MKKAGGLFERIISFENIYEAYLEARKGKRFRNEVLRFTHDCENYLKLIQKELIDGTYQVGNYREFYVYEPKKRLIMALPFRDRVVQWAIYRVIEPILDRKFIHDSYACRTGKGAQRAVSRVKHWVKQANKESKAYYLKMDVAKYYYRINHDKLLEILGKYIKCKKTLALLEVLIKNSNINFGVPLGDHSFKEEKVAGIGVPIGNLTSQLFANLYLNEMDHFLKRKLKAQKYARYMDDMVIISNDKAYLHEVVKASHEFLRGFGLELNNKTTIRPVSCGLSFVGYRIWPNDIRMTKTFVVKMKRNLKHRAHLLKKGYLSEEELLATKFSYLGFTKHANCKKLEAKWIGFHLKCFEKQI